MLLHFSAAGAGDSLTERSFAPGGWGARLAHQFYRKVDVVNRGLGGYNSRWAVQLVDDVLAGVDGEAVGGWLMMAGWLDRLAGAGASWAAPDSGISGWVANPVTHTSRDSRQVTCSLLTGTNTKLVTIFFGANDAARPDGPP